MKVPVKHLSEHRNIFIDIPDGYMLTFDYNQVLHLMNGPDHFLTYNTFTHKFETIAERGFTNDGTRYKNVQGDNITVGDLWIVVEKIKK